MTNRNSTTSNIIPVAAIMGAVLLWGSAFAAMKHLVDTLNPWAVMWMRTGIATLALAPFCARLSGPVKKEKIAKP